MGSGSNSNQNLDSWITQKQDFLEQLRPVGTGTGTGSVPIIIIPGTGAGTGTATATGTTTGTGTGTATGTGTGTGTGTATTTGAGTNAALNAAIYGGSPAASVLPQIIAQAAVSGGNNRRSIPSRRRVNRRRVNRRRPGRRGVRNGNNKRVIVIRPKA